MCGPNSSEYESPGRVKDKPCGAFGSLTRPDESRGFLKAFDGQRDALTAADAHGYQALRSARVRQLVEAFDGQNSAGRPDRVAQRDSPAIGLCPCRGQAGSNGYRAGAGGK